MELPEPVSEFFVANGFKLIEDNTKLENDKCWITLYYVQGSDERSYGYQVFFKDDGANMFSSDLNIYWLIGLLTYYECMDRNYKSIS